MKIDVIKTVNAKIDTWPDFKLMVGVGGVGIAGKMVNTYLRVRNRGLRHSLSTESVKTRLWAKKATLF